MPKVGRELPPSLSTLESVQSADDRDSPRCRHPGMVGLTEIWSGQADLLAKVQQMDIKLDALLERTFSHRAKLMNDSPLNKESLQRSDGNAKNDDSTNTTFQPSARIVSTPVQKLADQSPLPPPEIAFNLDTLYESEKIPFKRQSIRETFQLVMKANLSSRSEEQPTSTVCGRIIQDSRTDLLIVLVVILNSILIGTQVSLSEDDSSRWMRDFVRNLENACSVFFCVELAFRVAGLRSQLLREKHRQWFLFDSMLVLFTCAEFFLLVTFREASSDIGVVSGLMQAMRNARWLRVIRMIKFLTKLQVMVKMILSSLSSLVWLFIFSAVFSYAFAIVLTQGASAWKLKSSSKDTEMYCLMNDYFGTIPRSIYTLFLSLTGGVNWGEPASVLRQCGDMYFATYTMFMFIAFFSVLNIVTGVVVDGAIQEAEADRSIQDAKLQEKKECYIKDLNKLLQVLDVDGDGMVTEVEWCNFWNTNRASPILDSLDLKINDAMSVFTLLDVDGDGELSMCELIEGIDNLRGLVTRSDFHSMMKVLVDIQRELRPSEKPRRTAVRRLPQRRPSLTVDVPRG
eukprot:TRINITY_DN18080_c0_g1_i2.p1 TRINITY_DN18080_c0_g1~~TRINITY_DN18080_c0_g1_i2.p1  ORF type:complete len:570 (-),score=83.17 TRINITY_DN18080_c0_g1_i2:138-1847(-)